MGGGARKFVEENPGLVDEVLAAVAELGPCTAGQIEAYLEREAPGRKGPWWDRSETKWIAEALFSSGELTTDKRVGFSRHYQLAHKVIPADIYQRRGVRRGGSTGAAAVRSVRSGWGPEADIRDYFRTFGPDRSNRARRARRRGRGGESGRRRVGCTGISGCRTDDSASRPGTALLCPFDPLIFFRPRVERPFRFSLPHRDLHTRGQTAVRPTTCGLSCSMGSWWAGSTSRPIARPARSMSSAPLPKRAETLAAIVGPLAEQLVSMASWLGLERVAIGERGDLVRPWAPSFERHGDRIGDLQRSHRHGERLDAVCPLRDVGAETQSTVRGDRQLDVHSLGRTVNGQRSTHEIAGRCLADLLGMEFDGGKSLGIECFQCVRPHDRFLGPVSGVRPPSPLSTRNESTSTTRLTADGWSSGPSTEMVQASMTMVSRCPIRAAAPVTPVCSVRVPFSVQGSRNSRGRW
ncbi:hypothetical protein L833_5070 [Mycobacteroides abscessus MAB_091912_2446]|uniref:Uncharacterized protein n=1 Tax=Mycobacteroides abscessus MAB_091912_2446 TaxID=1335414 RepID=A0A829M7R3_9MYCO|nr:hypothetical protein L833_5070 [Mycobacteroides abscessus MAB_091912_2446]